MTEDVLAWGDERGPRRRAGSVVAGIATAAVLGIGIAGALRSPGGPSANATPTRSPTPSASFSQGWTEYPTGDAFEGAEVHSKPGDGSSYPVLIGGAPVWLVGDAGEVRAVSAIGGPAHARRLLAWCPTTHLVQDATGEYYYTLDGLGSAGLPIGTYATRPHGTTGNDVEVAPRATVAVQYGWLEGGFSYEGPRCTADELVWPPLPGRAEEIAGAAHGYALMTGRYVVTSESRAFCTGDQVAGCPSAGWEVRGSPGTALPAWDLASSYTYEGDFLVHADHTSGDLSVVLLPQSRLVGRAGAGASPRLGLADAVLDDGRLRFNPFREYPHAEDDSPPGNPPQANYGYSFMEDQRGARRMYVVAKGAEILLGPGYTGLGLPPGDLDVLRRFLADDAHRPLWLVLDAKGRVIRIVADPRPPV